jgi:hypothetical protein
MRICIVFQENHPDISKQDPIHKALASEGIDVVHYHYVPHMLESKVPLPTDVDIVSVAGSIKFVRDASAWCKSTVLYDMFAPELHRRTHYLHQVKPDERLNADALLTTFGELSNNLDYSILSNTHTSPFIIQPDQGLKVAELSLIESEHQFNEWLTYHRTKSGLTSNSLIWTAAGKKIQREWRCLISNGSVLSMSLYGLDIEPQNDDSNLKVLNFAGDAAKNINISDPAYMLDVAEVDGELYVIELNCLATSGIYALNRTALAKAWKNALSLVYERDYAF